jgi:hypothetical protein
MKGVTMNIKFDRAAVKLEADRFIKLQQCNGTKVHCKSGSLWITQDDDARDYILGPGQTLELEHDGDALVFALMQSEFTMSEPMARASVVDKAGEAVLDGLEALGVWVAERFGPRAISRGSSRNWHGAL